MGFLSESVAVITGAGSGWGVMQQLAGMGASMAIDVDEKGLAGTAALPGSPKGKVTQHIVNVADEASEGVCGRSRRNTAGHGALTTRVWQCWGNLMSCRWEDIRWLMGLISGGDSRRILSRSC
jgi:NAD(P)-dependent dehydrogenase (short-subunit alcohol dehydrogenase family)